MRSLTLAILVTFLPAVAGAQVPMSAVPSPCAGLDTMQVQPSGEWQMGADSLMHTPEGDTARVFAGTGMWACKQASGEVYVPTVLGGAVNLSGAIERAIMRRVSGDRTSPYYVLSFDHPARMAALVISKRDGKDALRRWGLPTDSLWVHDSN